jgi:hypothetical protein
MDIPFAHQLCAVNAQSTSQFGSRSSKRTDAFHRIFKQEIERVNPTVRCNIEHIFKIETGIYTCDLVVVSSENKVLACISTKATMTNYKQNKTNLENVKLGELLKMRDAAPEAAHIFFDVLPVECPYYSRDGIIQKMESINIEKTKEQQAALVRLCEKQGLSTKIFSIFAKYDYPSKGVVELDDVMNEEDMESFYEFIRSLGTESV